VRACNLNLGKLLHGNSAASLTLQALHAMIADNHALRGPVARTVSFRVPDDVARRVAERAVSLAAESGSDVYRRVIEEWLRMQEHPGIRFADGPGGRRAVLVGGPDVWEVILIARAFDLDVARLAAAYPWLTAERLAAARAYAEAYPEEIDGRIAENARAAAELERELAALGA
jgi:uncharacterized protein (DUF433 family)